MIREGQQDNGKYSRYFRLGATEVDLNNRLRIKSLMGFFQETAGDQCEKFGSGWETLWNEHGLCYVVVRLEVRMERYPRNGEIIRVDTWPENKLKLLFARYGEIFDADGSRLGAIASQWSPLDVKARHFVRPDPEIVAMPDTSSLSAPFELSREPLIPSASISDVSLRRFNMVRTPVYSDFDYNRHMNNARYAEWISDAFWSALTAEERAEAPAMKRLGIKFRTEIPAERAGIPVELNGLIDPEKRLFSMKGVSAGGTREENVSPGETVFFECEGEYEE